MTFCNKSSLVLAPSAVDEMLPFLLIQKYEDAPIAIQVKLIVIESPLILTVFSTGCEYICGTDAVETTMHVKVSISCH